MEKKVANIIQGLGSQTFDTMMKMMTVTMEIRQLLQSPFTLIQRYSDLNPGVRCLRACMLH